MRPGLVLFCLGALALNACGDPATAPVDDEPESKDVPALVNVNEGSCTATVLWLPDVLPGHLAETDPAPYRDAALAHIEGTFAQLGIEMTDAATVGFLVQFAHTDCGMSSFEMNDALFLHQDEQDASGLQYIAISPAELGMQTAEEYAAAYLEWDRRLLGFPPAEDEDALRGGPNGYGRCNVFATWQPAPPAEGDPPQDPELAFDLFYEASLEEVNYGDYEYLPYLHSLEGLVGLAAFGDCTAAMVQAEDFLNSAIARIGDDDNYTPIHFHLFLPDQVEGMTTEETESAWITEALVPAGPSNFQ